MPTFEIRSPDGRTFRITAPDGATQEQVMAQLSAGGQGGELPAPQPEDTRPALQRFFAGSGKSVEDIALGARQRAGAATQEEVTAKLRADEPLMKTTAGKLGNFVGNVGMTLPAMFLPGGQSLVGSAIMGGGLGALQPTREGESAVTNAALGAGAGALGQGAANLIGRAVTPVQAPALSAEQRALVELAKQKGIPLSAGQQTLSRPLQALESVLAKLPFTSGTAEKFRQSQQSGFNRALLNTMGQQGDSLAPEVLGAAKQRIGGEFNRLSSQNDLKVTLPFLQKLSAYKGEIDAKQTEDVARIVGSYIDDLSGHIAQNGTVPGTFYKSLDSKIGRQAFGTSNGDLRNSLKDLQRIVREGMDASIQPADQEAWKAARSQWGNMKTVAGAVKNDASGEAFPGRLAQSVRRSNENAMVYGQGNTELADLAKLGNGVLKDSVPNSGTAERMYWQKFLDGSLLTQGLKLGEGAAGAASVPLQKLLLSEAGRKYLAEGLLAADAPMRKIGPYGSALLRGGAPAFLLTGNGIEYPALDAPRW